MDNTTKPYRADPNNPYWKHTQPVKVRDFLDSWLTAPPRFNTFSEALCHGRKGTDAEGLQRFLDAHVFFNHFIRLDSMVSIQKIVCAWNRGAAIMPKENTHSFDHVIPVMLAPQNGEAATFGPLHDDWDDTELDRACSNVSFILINSRNYTAAVDHDPAAYGCTPNADNFEDIKKFVGKDVTIDFSDRTPKTVYLSIAQGFGPKRRTKESYVNILVRKDQDITFRNVRTFRQIAIVLKELGPQTYKCLQEKFDYSNQMDVDVQAGEECPVLPEDEAEELGYGERAEATKYLRKLRNADIDYLEDVDKDDIPAVLDFLPLVYSGEVMQGRNRRCSRGSRYGRNRTGERQGKIGLIVDKCPRDLSENSGST